MAMPIEDTALATWWKGGAKRLLSIGTLKSAKDYPTLIRSLKILRESVDARLLILGEGRERPVLENLIFELDLCEVVKLAGYRADPFPFLREADLFVLSSAWEGLGNVITEALSCGTPVVSTNCQSGPAEILDSGRFGTLVPVGDVEALATAIASVLGHPYDSARLKQRACEFSPKIAADKYISLLFD
jgi:glycosyltransferase involved in cell wall biosynthesis